MSTNNHASFISDSQTTAKMSHKCSILSRAGLRERGPWQGFDAMASAEHKPITEVWDGNPGGGSGGKAP